MAKRILVVDDNPVNLKLASEVLRLEGYAVEQAMDAEQAQELLRESVPDLVLMDIALPGMDGLALTRWIKADARLNRVPVVALTAFAMKGDDRRIIEAGCDGYIAKPINTRELPSRVAQFLAGRDACGS